IKAATRSRNRRGHRTRKVAGCFFENRLLIALRCKADRTHLNPNNARHVLLAPMHTDHLDWSLPAYRRGTLRGMDAA
ncbi:hypothetical protein NEH39_19395, partial [Xanthomonas hortorum pv. pelargonii]|nr:hypothetical protein [Xanthomonas hortorum pv. pelargonii]